VPVRLRPPEGWPPQKLESVADEAYEVARALRSGSDDEVVREKRDRTGGAGATSAADESASMTAEVERRPEAWIGRESGGDVGGDGRRGD
jgi:hypothetical protein